MPPKFQSSFIPKGPLAGASPVESYSPHWAGLFNLGVIIVFTISLLGALGVFGYKIYAQKSLTEMEAKLQEARRTLDMPSIEELMRLNDRIISADMILKGHVALSPFVKYLEESTLRSVRFNELKYSGTSAGIELTMQGESRGYSALAFQSEVFGREDFFQNQEFSDLSLNKVGNVVFSFSAAIDPSLVSFKNLAEGSLVEEPDAPISETGPEEELDSGGSENIFDDQ